MSEWQPIETAPRNGHHFFATGPMPSDGIAAPNCWFVAIARWEHNALVTENFRLRARDLTHWMPLPTPPRVA